MANDSPDAPLPSIEPEPGWLMNMDCQLTRFPWPKMLHRSVYYPASGFDGQPVRFLGRYFQSYIYVDYGVSQEVVVRRLDEFLGYKVIGHRHVTKSELVPNGWIPLPPKPEDVRSSRQIQRIRGPFAIWAVLERKEEYSADHGPARISLLYICGDGVATFQAIYHGNEAAPAVVAIIQPGTGFGGNWTNFEDPQKCFARSVMQNPHGQPEYLLYGGWGESHFYTKPCWPEFSGRVRAFSGRLRLWRRPNHG